MYCPTGKLFSSVYLVCVTSSLVTCGTTTTTSTTTSTTTVIYPVTCISQEILIPDPDSTDCTSYYQCYNDGFGNLYPVLRYCPTDTLFSSDYLVCVTSSLVTCGTPTESPSVTSSYPVTCRFQSSPVADPASTDCTTYYQCYIDSNYKLYPVLMYCPTNKAFSVLHGYCMDAAYVKCGSSAVATTTTEVPVTCKTDGTSIADPASADCTSYYKCNLVNGVLTPVLTNCLAYMAFSTTYGRCIHDYYVTCTTG
jgi:hypothetical protein